MCKERIYIISKSNYYKLLVVFLGLGVATLAFSRGQPEETAKQMLMAMVEAVKMQNYKGTVVYLRDNQVETMRVYHANKDGIEQERIVALNSPMREVIRSGEKVTCYFPDTRVILVDNQPSHRSFLVQLPENVEKYAKYYDFVLTGHEYVVRKETQVIQLLPKDEYRYGRKIWIDIENHLPLKFELIDEKGRLIEQMMFTDLQLVDGIPSEKLLGPAESDISGWQLRDRGHSSEINNAWVFGGIPGGFQQIFYKKRIMPTDNQAVEHILFSDGFSSVSIYVDKKTKDLPKSYHKKMGAINSYSRLLDGYQITVLGAVPGKTVQTIGDGIEFMTVSH